MSAPDPQETWRRIQTNLQRQATRYGGGGGPNPRAALGGFGLLLALGGGAVLVNNALFNGKLHRPYLHLAKIEANIPVSQWTEVIARSNIPE